MKKKLLFLCLLNLFGYFLYAQETIDSALTNLMQKNYSCENASNQCALLFVEYMESERPDLVYDLFDYWQERCGITEPFQRAKILFNIDQKRYIDAVLHNGIMDWVVNYQNRILDYEESNNENKYESNKEYFGYIPIAKQFDRFTQKLAAKNMPLYPQKSIEYAWCEFYSQDPELLFGNIQRYKYSGSKLSNEYYERLGKIKNEIDWNWAISSGVWIPLGEMSDLGVHPEIGLLFGGRGKKFSCDFDLSVRFLNSSHEYYARRNDSLCATNYFLGAYIGVDFGYDIYQTKKGAFTLLGGLGWDGFRALKEDVSRGYPIVSVSSYNFNLGLGYRYYLTRTLYMAVQLKANIVDYTLNNVTNYSKGCPITLKFIFGSISNPMKNSLLKRLDYNGR